MPEPEDDDSTPGGGHADSQSDDTKKTGEKQAEKNKEHESPSG